MKCPVACVEYCLITRPDKITSLNQHYQCIAVVLYLQTWRHPRNIASKADIYLVMFLLVRKLFMLRDRDTEAL